MKAKKSLATALCERGCLLAHNKEESRNLGERHEEILFLLGVTAAIPQNNMHARPILFWLLISKMVPIDN